MKHWLAVAAVAGSIAAAPAASADSLTTRQHQRGVITHIDEGVFQLGIDSTLLLSLDRAGDETVSRGSATGAAMLRYFVQPSLGVSGRIGGVYRRAGSIRDVGLSGMAWGNYFLRLGEGMFFAPGAGAGLLIGQRDVPQGAGQVARERLLGVMVATELMGSMYLNRRFSLNAGPEFTVTMGTAGGSFAAINGSFKVGAAYSF